MMGGGPGISSRLECSWSSLIFPQVQLATTDVRASQANQGPARAPAGLARQQPAPAGQARMAECLCMII